MSVYDEVEIEDMDFDPEQQVFFYSCPCGDKFRITLDQISKGEDIAQCPSCSLTIRVIYDDGSYDEFKKYCQDLAIQA